MNVKSTVEIVYECLKENGPISVRDICNKIGKIDRKIYPSLIMTTLVNGEWRGVFKRKPYRGHEKKIRNIWSVK